MKNIIRLATAVFALVATSFAGISISKPASGAVTNSPLHVVATASPWGSASIKTMQVYIDGGLVYNRAGSGVDAYFNIGTGGHQVTVKAWDGAGGSSSKAVGVTASGSGIVLSSPTPNSTVSSSTRILAKGYAPSGITAMKVYDNGDQIVSVSGGTVDKTVSLSNGSHYLVTQAWDTHGTVFAFPALVNVGSGGGTPAPVPSPSNPGSSQVTIPSTALKKVDIDQMSGWQHCDACAGIGGNGPQTAYSMTQGVSTPSIDGKSEIFWLGGSTPYSNALWWKQLGAVDTAKHFVYDIQFFFKNMNAVQALEFDVNQSVGGLKYIFGTECSVRNNNGWRIWDTKNVQWIKSGRSCTLKVNEWNHLTWEFERVGNQTHFIAVTLNGYRQIVDKYFYARSVGSAREMNVAFQMDGNYQQEDYSVWADKITLYYW